MDAPNFAGDGVFDPKPYSAGRVNKARRAGPWWSGLEKREHIMTDSLRPGQSAPRSGQYEQVGPRGGRTGEERTVTRGEPLPPTPKPGMGYVLVDPTKH